MQQATVNLLADMGAQPGSLTPGLVSATGSSDAQAPQSSISSPANGASVTVNSSVTVSGTAGDIGGGVVGGIEVSTDDGQTWHPATGTSDWTYTWRPASSGQYTLLSRAADDSGNLEQTPSTGVSVTVAWETTPPTIGGLAAVSGADAPIAWTANEVALSQVPYGLAKAYGPPTRLDPLLVSARSQTLSELALLSWQVFQASATARVTAALPARKPLYQNSIPR